MPRSSEAKARRPGPGTRCTAKMAGSDPAAVCHYVSSELQDEIQVCPCAGAALNDPSDTPAGEGHASLHLGLLDSGTNSGAALPALPKRSISADIFTEEVFLQERAEAGNHVASLGSVRTFLCQELLLSHDAGSAGIDPGGSNFWELPGLRVRGSCAYSHRPSLLRRPRIRDGAPSSPAESPLLILHLSRSIVDAGMLTSTVDVRRCSIQRLPCFS